MLAGCCCGAALKASLRSVDKGGADSCGSGGRAGGCWFNLMDVCSNSIVSLDCLSISPVVV